MTGLGHEIEVVHLDHDRWVAASRVGCQGMVEIRLRFPLDPQFPLANAVLAPILNARAAVGGRSLRRLGVELSARSDVDALSVGLGTPVEHAAFALQTALGILTAPRYDADEVYTATQHYARMLDLARHDPSVVADELTNEAIYGPHHPYGMRLNTEELASLEPEAVFNTLSRTLGSPEGRIAIAGDAPAVALIEMVVTGARGLVVQTHERMPLAVPPFPTTSWHRLRPEQEGAQLRVVWPAPAPTAERLQGAELMVAALGGGSASMLFKEVRERRGLCYEIRARIVHATEASACVVSTSTQSRRADETMQAILETTEQFTAEPPTTEALAQWSVRLQTSRAVGTSTPGGRVERIMSLWQSWGLQGCSNLRKEVAARQGTSLGAEAVRTEEWQASRTSVIAVAQQTFPTQQRVEVVVTGS